MLVIPFKKYTKNEENQKIYSVRQTQSRTDGPKVTASDNIIQSFQTKNYFNTILLNFKTNNLKHDAVYYLRLINADSKQVLYEWDVAAKRMKDGANEFKFDKLIKPVKNTLYLLELTSEDATIDNCLSLNVYNYYYADAIKHGNLWINHEEQVNTDLAFQVYHSFTAPLIPTKTYYIFAFIVLMVSLTILLCFYKIVIKQPSITSIDNMLTNEKRL